MYFHTKRQQQWGKTYSVFGSTFIKLILDRIDFVVINLVRIDFEVK